MRREAVLAAQAVLGAAAVTAAEFCAGAVLDDWLRCLLEVRRTA